MRASMFIVTMFLPLTTIVMNLGCGREDDSPDSELDSLTEAWFSGKKYYFGWGAAGSNDPDMMHNEVKYDVLHTHDIFTNNVGGSYQSEKMVGTSVTASKIRNSWSRYEDGLSADDMYVQYSSGHGMTSGLGVGVSYKEMADFALNLKAKEVIILTMACYSGNLVDEFNSRSSTWQNRLKKEGRSLFVMASSASNDTSSTGPGTDREEPAGRNGTAGSAFGHALWKSLIGHADGFVDGIKDGYLSLEEIREYTKKLTREIGGHDIQVTGTYHDALIMNRVPGKSFRLANDNPEAQEAFTNSLSRPICQN